MTKSFEDYFSDWEGHAFGFGYGTGEAHVVPAIRKFFELTFNGGSRTAYDYVELEQQIGPIAAWLLINALCRDGVEIIEYGTSPRCGWITEEGERLREFMLSRSDEQLVALANRDADYNQCWPQACNCGSDGYEPGRKCQNPFWKTK